MLHTPNLIVEILKYIWISTNPVKKTTTFSAFARLLLGRSCRGSFSVASAGLSECVLCACVAAILRKPRAPLRARNYGNGLGFTGSHKFWYSEYYRSIIIHEQNLGFSEWNLGGSWENMHIYKQKMKVLIWDRNNYGYCLFMKNSLFV